MRFQKAAFLPVNMEDPKSRGYRPIEDYAAIGDCSSVALISKMGSIDWLCWPHFDSPSTFASLLDDGKGGRFRICPSKKFDVRRRYVGDTNVLETTFITDGGQIRLTDLMPADDFESYDRQLWPDHSLIRKVECLGGDVEVEVFFEPRPDYARCVPKLEKRGDLGYFCNHKETVLTLRTDVALDHETDSSRLTGRLTMRPGEVRQFVLSMDRYEPAVLIPLGEHVEAMISRTLKYWEEWSAKCRYVGPHRDAVMRSALAIKLMTFSRSGAVVAAATTSLPEEIGGVRNWDYRYCWLRDAGLSLRALFDLGYSEEGAAFFSWMLHSTRKSLPHLHIMYDIYGNVDLEEFELDHLEGWRKTSPVRIGNGAYDQLQLDTYGEVAAAAFEYVAHGHTLDASQKRMLTRTGDALIERWHKADEGIWEIRNEQKHHTYSKVMSWVTVDRLIRLHEHGDLEIDLDRYKKVRKTMRDEIEEKGVDKDLGAFVNAYGTKEMDASLLLIPDYGFVEADDPRMIRTYELIQEELADGVLLYRYKYDDNLPGEEGAFGICSFWDEEYLARLGRVDEAMERFEKILTYANDVGLYAEQIDPATGIQLGNFPQAFSHVGLINAILMIADKLGQGVPDETDPTLSRKEREV
jgi:GH15 family glucan-1,4-alpha-glucosidase